MGNISVENKYRSFIDPLVVVENLVMKEEHEYKERIEFNYDNLDKSIDALFIIRKNMNTILRRIDDSDTCTTATFRFFETLDKITDNIVSIFSRYAKTKNSVVIEIILSKTSDGKVAACVEIYSGTVTSDETTEHSCYTLQESYTFNVTPFITRTKER